MFRLNIDNLYSYLKKSCTTSLEKLDATPSKICHWQTDKILTKYFHLLLQSKLYQDLEQILVFLSINPSGISTNQDNFCTLPALFFKILWYLQKAAPVISRFQDPLQKGLFFLISNSSQNPSK